MRHSWGTRVSWLRLPSLTFICMCFRTGHRLLLKVAQTLEENDIQNVMCKGNVVM